MSNNIEVYEDAVRGIKEIPHCTFRSKGDEENNIFT